MPYGNKGEAWRVIGERFASAFRNTSCNTPPEWRACKDRYEVLYNQQKKLNAAPSNRSGSNEPYTELEQLLTDCVSGTRQREQQKSEVKEQEVKKRHRIDRTQGRSRVHTMQTLGQR